MPAGKSDSQSWILVAPNPSKSLGKAAEFFGRNLETDPEIETVIPEKNSITIEQIRELQISLSTPSIGQKGKLVLIAPAENITLPAQQALLKLLEEPPVKTTIALVTSSASALLPTIQSRCQIAVLENSVKQKGHWLSRLAKTRSMAEKTSILSQLPEEKEDLLQALIQMLSEPAEGKREVELKTAVFQAIAGLKSNVSPSLCRDLLALA